MVMSISNCFSQKKTINLPTTSEILKNKNGEIFLNKVDDINFYATVYSGRLLSINAKKVTDNTNIPLFFHSTFDENTGKSTCEACRCLYAPDGGCLEGSEQCYEFDCGDLLPAPSNNVKPMPGDSKTINIEASVIKPLPSNKVSGPYSIYKDSELELFANYSKNKIVNFSANSFKSEKIYVMVVSSSTIAKTSFGKPSHLCYLKVTSVDNNGNTKITNVPVSCDKLPFPSSKTN